MRSTWFVLALAFLCSGPVLPAQVRPTESERQAFAETKARAEEGNAAAQLALGDAYMRGAGTTEDPKKAAKWHRKSAEQGLASAEYQLGLDYLKGYGVKPDKVEGVKWISKAADQGLIEAEVTLARCLSQGIGLKRNAAEGVKIYRKLAERGLAEGEFELGRSYLEGEGVAKNIGEGVKWIGRAAEQGFAPAQQRFGLCHVKGEGVSKDLVQAYKWLILAAAQDDERALDIRVELAKLDNSLSQEQTAEAQKLASEFKPRQSPDGSAVAQTRAADGLSTNSGGAQVGYVRIQAEDESHEVYIDGAFVGNTPTKVKLSEGTHVIEVRKPGFKDYRKEIKITDGAELNLRAQLEKN